MKTLTSWFRKLIAERKFKKYRKAIRNAKPSGTELSVLFEEGEEYIRNHPIYRHLVNEPEFIEKWG